MRFGVLGQVEYSVAGESRCPAGQRQQRLLAVLLLASGRSVPRQHVIDAVWPHQCPATVRHQLHNAVSSLRHQLAADPAPPVIESSAAGCALVPDGHELDLDLFRSLLVSAERYEARSELARAVSLLRQAARLWRGPALAGVAGDGPLQALAYALEELRLAATVRRIRLEVQLGREFVAISELAELVSRYPMREDLVELQMIALRQAGRRADALQAYSRLRACLAGELGLDPQRRLIDLHRAILADAA
jgi:DNA-binding SARP family transcriptional activator